MIGAHIDTKGGIVLGVIRQNQLFTIWYKKALGGESKETDLWVHLFKKRRNLAKRNGTSRHGF